MAISTKMIAVIVVVVIAVAAAGVFLMTQGNNNEQKNYDNIEVTETLAVYGNADGNAIINDYDVDILQDIIDGKKNMSNYPLADANKDGTIDSKDIEIVKKMMKHEECEIYVIGQNYDSIENQTDVKVKYPVTNAVSYGTNMNAALLYVGGEDSVAGFFRSNYQNFEAALVEKAEDLGGGAGTAEAGWPDFTVLAGKKTIGTFFADKSKISGLTAEYKKDLDDAGIPLIILPITDAKDEIASTLLIGFLLGEKTEKIAQEYATTSWNVFKNIEEKMKSITTKPTVISISMGSKVVKVSSENYDTIREAGGVPYWEVNEAFKKAFAKTVGIKTGETLSNYDDADYMISVRSIDSKSENLKQTMIDTWEAWDEYFEDLDNYENLCYINNLLPGAIKVAYHFEMMFPELAGKGYGDSVFNEVAKTCSYLKGCTVDNTFTKMTYEDYVKLKA